MITKCFFKHLVCFRCRLAEFEAEFDANPLLLHMSLWQVGAIAEQH
jgi:hypothetical protein